MHDESPLSESLNRKIEALCDHIAPSGEFDADTRQEFLAHLEKKTLAYRNGSQPLSDDDIVLLVENHFGDAARLRDVFHTVSARSMIAAKLHSLARLGRRMIALVVAVTVVAILQETVTVIATAICESIWHDDASRLAAAEWIYFSSIVITTSSLIGLLVLWHRAARGKAHAVPWFDRLAFWKVLLIGVVMLLARRLLEGMLPLRPAPTFAVLELKWVPLARAVAVVCSVVTILTWMIWCAGSMRPRWRPIALGVVPLVAYQLGPWLTIAAWGIALPAVAVPNDQMLLVAGIRVPSYTGAIWTEAAIFTAMVVVVYLLIVRPLGRAFDAQLAD